MIWTLPRSTLNQVVGNRNVVVAPAFLAPVNDRLVQAIRVLASLVQHAVRVEGRVAGVGCRPRSAKVDEPPAYVVVGVDITDQNADLVERLQIRPHLRDILECEGVGALGDVLDDGANREAPVLLVPPPDPSALGCSQGFWERRVAGLEDQFGDLEFLRGGEEQVPVGRDGEVLPVLLLEPTVGAALTVKRVDVLVIKVSGGEIPVEMACTTAFQVASPVEEELNGELEITELLVRDI